MCELRLERMIDVPRPTTVGGTGNPTDSPLDKEM